jgi:transcriptional regulator with XRE-family HTH domain
MDKQPMTHCGERIHLERVKRSWSQEQLAERAGMSVRTIQRIESGQVPALETMRLLADALGIGVDELHSETLRRHFPALWSTQLKISTTAFFAILFLIAGLIPWLSGLHASGQEGLTALVVLFPIILSIVTMLFSVGGYSVENGHVLIHRMGWSNRFVLRELSEVRVLPYAMMGSMKVCGSAGVFGSIGWFRNGVLGSYRAYVTHPQKTLVLGFGKNRIVISPDDPEAMKQAIDRAVKELPPLD